MMHDQRQRTIPVHPIHSEPLHSVAMVKLSREKWVVEYAKYEEDDQNKMLLFLCNNVDGRGRGV